MRRFLLLACVFLAIPVQAQVRLRATVTLPLPSPTLTCPSPAGGVSGTPYSGSFTATGGTPPYTTYAITVGALPNGLSLNASTGDITGTPSVVASFNFTGRVTDSAGQTGSQACTINISGVSSFVDHPRIWLTSAKLTELAAKKKANHADYLAMKAAVDTFISLNPWITDNTTLSGSLTSSATSFTVADGSIFPSSNLYVRIDQELILCTSRSGNTLSGCTRGAPWVSWGRNTNPVAHAASSVVWDHPQSGDPASNWVNLCHMAALLVRMGDSSYATTTRGLMSILNTHLFMYLDIYGGPEYNAWDPNLGGDILFVESQDYSRWYIPGLAMAFDWCYDICSFTAAEKAMYAESLRLSARAHLAEGYCSTNCAILPYSIRFIEDLNGLPPEPHFYQSQATGNAQSGEIYSSLLAALASYGDNADALDQYTEAKRQYDTYTIPAISTGPASGGFTHEGMQYVGESWMFIGGTGLAIDTATGTTTYQDTYLQTWIAKVFEFIAHETLPGSTNVLPADEPTTGSMTIGGTTLTVNSNSGWSVGMTFRAFQSGQENIITNISGTTLTTAYPALVSFSGNLLLHTGRWISWGDVRQQESDYYSEGIMYDEQIMAPMLAVDLLKTANPTYASYARYWLANKANAFSHAQDYLSRKLIWDDTSVSSVNYSALATLWVTGQENACGSLFGRTGWATTDTIVQYLSGCDQGNHVHSDKGAYQIYKSGVPLSTEISGYSGTGPDPYPGVWAVPDTPATQCSEYCFIGESQYNGGRQHNTVLMNGHSPTNTFLASVEDVGYTTSPRSEANTSAGYAYIRSDISGSQTSSVWALMGYANNYAQTWIRDFLYIPASNIVAFVDRLGYTAASLSPTTWIAQFTGDPSMAGQRITSTYGGQTIVQDVVYPTGATFTEVNEMAEEPYLTTWFTRPYYRIETTSGATTASETGLQIIQLGASGFSPLSVTGLTTTNANIAQVGTLVIGGVTAATPSLPITYTVSGTPVHYLMGFAASTAYHVTRASNTITIAAATGSGDTTATAAGVLTFTL